MEIGNALGIFYEVDKSYCDFGYMGMAQILVGMDLTKGLEDSITIRRGTKIFYQPINYEGIPFKCGRCHVHGHLATNCPFPNRRNLWV
jgi:hypothetical protein